MIIFRYLAREILLTSLAVVTALLFIIMVSRFNKYLSMAAEGDLASNVLFVLLIYQLPRILEMLMPLSLFMGVLLAFGRLYSESEMVVLSACGISTRRIIFYTLLPTFCVAGLVGYCSLVLSPVATDKFQEIYDDPQNFQSFSTLVKGRFQEQHFGNFMRVSYTEDLSQDKSQMQHVFVADQQMQSDKPPRLSVTLADSGRIVQDKNNQQRYLELKNGFRYEGTPGTAEYRVTAFDTLGQVIRDPQESSSKMRIEAVPTEKLITEQSPANTAALQWRLSMPLLCPIIALIALPLSKTSHRQGRFAKILPAILIYLVYFVLLTAAQTAVAKEKLSPFIGLWGIHLIFISLAFTLLQWSTIKQWWSTLTSRQPARA